MAKTLAQAFYSVYKQQERQKQLTEGILRENEETGPFIITKSSSLGDGEVCYTRTGVWSKDYSLAKEFATRDAAVDFTETKKMRIGVVSVEAKD